MSHRAAPPQFLATSGMEHGHLPTGLTLQRTTDEFAASSAPNGLLRAHRVARGVWGRLRVIEGQLRFVWEQPDAGDPLDLYGGKSVITRPTPCIGTNLAASAASRWSSTADRSVSGPASMG